MFYKLGSSFQGQLIYTCERYKAHGHESAQNVLSFLTVYKNEQICITFCVGHSNFKTHFWNTTQMFQYLKKAKNVFITYSLNQFVRKEKLILHGKVSLFYPLLSPVSLSHFKKQSVQKRNKHSPTQAWGITWGLAVSFILGSTTQLITLSRLLFLPKPEFLYFQKR